MFKLTGSGFISHADNVGATSFVAQESSQVYGLPWLVLGESLDPWAKSSRALLGVEGHGAMTGRTELPVRLKISVKI